MIRDMASKPSSRTVGRASPNKTILGIHNTVAQPPANKGMTGTLTLVGVARRLRQETNAVGGIRPWCDTHGIHPSVVDHFLRGQRGPSPQLLYALRLRKVVRFQIIQNQRTKRQYPGE